MGEVINLRQARKRATRVEQEKQAAVNRAKFGQSKAERAAKAREQERVRRQLDGAKKDAPQD